MKKITAVLILLMMVLAGCTMHKMDTDILETHSNAKPAMLRAMSLNFADSREQEVPVQLQFNTEEYDRIYEDRFLRALSNPLSTFSIDVDTASYSNIRRFINASQLPPQDAVRIEEMINYFQYDYPQPNDEHPFSLTTELSQCPWQQSHKIVHIGVKGKDLLRDSLPDSNLVFLLDVSGSMSSQNKLPLLKKAFGLLSKQLTDRDSVSIVVYAGAAGIVLPPTKGNDEKTILMALQKLEAGGSTAGGEGIQAAYDLAKKNFIKGGNNRVILATDGDFNIGTSSDAELIRLIEEKRKEGIFLTVLGFGTGNYKDSKMEKLADSGNGNYAYIDSLREAKKVLVEELAGTLVTIAKDVKIQVEFNPAKVAAYRLIGYENRSLSKEDFMDDSKDAGELGAGHSVTSLYEIILNDSEDATFMENDLKYQNTTISPEAMGSDELMTVKMRYKRPDGDESILLTHTVFNDQTTFEKSSDNFRFSTAVAEFGLLLRKSEFSGDATYEQVLEIANEARGCDTGGYRAEFIRLVETAQLLDSGNNIVEKES